MFVDENSYKNTVAYGVVVFEGSAIRYNKLRFRSLKRRVILLVAQIKKNENSCKRVASFPLKFAIIGKTGEMAREYIKENKTNILVSFYKQWIHSCCFHDFKIYIVNMII